MGWNAETGFQEIPYFFSGNSLKPRVIRKRLTPCTELYDPFDNTVFVRQFGLTARVAGVASQLSDRRVTSAVWP